MRIVNRGGAGKPNRKSMTRLLRPIMDDCKNLKVKVFNISERFLNDRELYVFCSSIIIDDMSLFIFLILMLLIILVS